MLKNLAPDNWYQLQNTKLRTVCPSETQFPNIHGALGCAGVMAYSGGTMDTTTSKLYIWGGGHSDYYGNEIYTFDLETLNWSRITDPTDPPTLSTDPMNDGKPVSRHTYDGLVFLTSSNKLFAYGGSKAGNGWGTSVTWIFNTTTGVWSNMLPTGDPGPETNCCNFSSAYDPVNNLVYMRDPNYLLAYNVAANSWKRVRYWPHTWGPQKMIFNKYHRILLSFGSGELLAYRPTGDTNVSYNWVTTGGDPIINGYGPGVAYDTKMENIVGWVGGNTYTLDIPSRQWTRQTCAYTPPNQIATGTYGRFQYDPRNNVFILVNGVDENVYIYKASAGPIQQPVAPLNSQKLHVQINGRKVK
jgi:hypothetical protein